MFVSQIQQMWKERWAFSAYIFLLIFTIFNNFVEGDESLSRSLRAACATELQTFSALYMEQIQAFCLEHQILLDVAMHSILPDSTLNSSPDLETAWQQEAREFPTHGPAFIMLWP